MPEGDGHQLMKEYQNANTGSSPFMLSGEKSLKKSSHGGGGGGSSTPSKHTMNTIKEIGNN